MSLHPHLPPHPTPHLARPTTPVLSAPDHPLAQTVLGAWERPSQKAQAPGDLPQPDHQRPGVTALVPRLGLGGAAVMSHSDPGPGCSCGAGESWV